MRESQLVARRRALARYGEDIAARWYEQHGYQVVARNWSCPAGELDIVARKGDQYVFCEVKARSSASLGLPAEAVGYAKRARLRRLAAIWLAEERSCATQQLLAVSQGRAGGAAGVARPLVAHRGVAHQSGAGPAPSGRHTVRFDVASVLAGRLQVIEGAF